MKKIALISVLALLPLAAFGAIDAHKINDGAYVLTTSKNIYSAGNAINIFEETEGSIFAAANFVSVTADVSQNVFAAANNVSIISEISGDVKAVGANVSIGGPVDGEVMLAGGQISIAPSSVINGDFLAAGGRIDVAGTINGDTKISADEVSISGTLNEDAGIKAKRLVIGKTAVINGNVNYKGEKEAVIEEGAEVNGEISFTKIEGKKSKAAAKLGLGAGLSIFWLLKFLAMAAAALVLFFLLRRNISRIINEAVNKFWKKLLRGFITLIVIPAAIILLFITIIGFPLALFGLALYWVLIIAAKIIAVIIIAELLNRLFFRKEKSRALSWPMVILGAIVMELLIFVPVLGWIVKCAIFLAAFGAVSSLIYKQNKSFAE